jgi:hypothetical protein
MGTTLKQVNHALAVEGKPERLVRGKGYFYFTGGTAAQWHQSGVYVYRLGELTVIEWLRERDRLESDWQRSRS